MIEKINKYYTEKVLKYGTTSQGVDWNGKESHFLRFEQLCKVLPKKSIFSLLDYGCGFGSLIEYIKDNVIECDYTGFDISDEMLKKGKTLYPNHHFISKLEKKTYDYTITNGVFNVKLDCGEGNWKTHIKETLNEINEISIKGFSFNLLTSYSDVEYMQDYLHYADPLEWFDYCKKKFSKNVALLHDYELYEFTIIVRK